MRATWSFRVISFSVLGNFLCYLFDNIGGQGPTVPTMLAVGAGDGCLAIFFLSSVISLFVLPFPERRSRRLDIS